MVISESMAEKQTEPYERRREQVRRAQKAHRARKDEYVKSLEEEVIQLRRTNAENIKKLLAQQSIIDSLRKALTASGQPIHDDLVTTNALMHTATVSFGEEPFPNQELHVHLPAAGNSWNGLSSMGPTGLQNLGISDPNNSCAPPSQANNIQFQHAHPQGLDSAQIGISFVLALEHTCLYHHRELSPELEMLESPGTGHERMLSASIMSHAPPFSPSPYDVGFPPTARWEVPAAELETLLQRSQDLGLDAEITPVQAWHEISLHAKFNLLSYLQLSALRQEIFPLVECHGFGAALDRNKFSDLLSTTFDSI